LPLLEDVSEEDEDDPAGLNTVDAQLASRRDGEHVIAPLHMAIVNEDQKLRQRELFEDSRMLKNLLVSVVCLAERRQDGIKFRE
jgi:hypothetical protein